MELLLKAKSQDEYDQLSVVSSGPASESSHQENAQWLLLGGQHEDQETPDL